MKLYQASPVCALPFLLAAHVAPLDQDLTCPAATDVSGLTAWRLQLATGLQSGSMGDYDVATQLSSCFPQAVPSCLQRLRDYSSRRDLANASNDVTAANSAEKTPPNEILAPGGPSGQYVLPPDIEATAAQRGWLSVRYKSRHSGGFDPGTPSLLMVYVPGDKVDPPVPFDRWLNFALPADSGDDAMKPIPQAQVPTADDYAQEANGSLSLPRTFTMVTLDRSSGATAPAKIYFQKFYRSQDGSPNFTAEDNSSPSLCYSCHPNGMRAISPLGFHVQAGEPQLDPAAWTATKQINAAMDTAAGHAVVSWRQASDDSGVLKPLLKPAAQGPSRR